MAELCIVLPALYCGCTQNALDPMFQAYYDPTKHNIDLTNGMCSCLMANASEDLTMSCDCLPPYSLSGDGTQCLAPECSNVAGTLYDKTIHALSSTDGSCSCLDANAALGADGMCNTCVSADYMYNANTKRCAEVQCTNASVPYNPEIHNKADDSTCSCVRPHALMGADGACNTCAEGYTYSASSFACITPVCSASLKTGCVCPGSLQSYNASIHTLSADGVCSCTGLEGGLLSTCTTCPGRLQPNLQTKTCEEPNTATTGGSWDAFPYASDASMHSTFGLLVAFSSAAAAFYV